MIKFILVLSLLFSLNSLFGAKYAGEIFRMGAGVRNQALGNTGITDEGSFALAYWNAALLSRVEETRFELSHAEEFSGLLKYDTFSAIWGNKSRFSLVVSRIGINNVPLTKLENPDEEISNDNRPYKYKSITNSDYIVHFGFARQVGNYSLGFTPKFAYRSLAEESGYGFGADISSFYEINQNFMLGANLRDFFSTQIFWQNGTHEIVNPSLDLEGRISFKAPYVERMFNLFVNTEILAEGRKEASTFNLGQLSLDFRLGLAMNILNGFDTYLGYDVEHFTTGLSLQINRYLVNYAFKQNTALDNSHRISLGMRI